MSKTRTVEQMMADLIAENNREEAKRSKKYTAEQAEKEAAFLKRWAKGKPIVRQGSEGTFWAAGKWMTKLDFGMVDLIVKGGHGKLTGDAKQRGATLLMN